MTNKEMLQQILNTTTEIKNDISTLDKRVTALEQNRSNTVAPKGSKKSGKADTPKEAKKEITLDSFKFDKYNEGCCNWDYYKAVRTSYCYQRQGCKVWKGTVTKPEGFVFDRAKWDADKEAFNTKFPYIKKADR